MRATNHRSYADYWVESELFSPVWKTKETSVGTPFMASAESILPFPDAINGVPTAAAIHITRYD